MTLNRSFAILQEEEDAVVAAVEDPLTSFLNHNSFRFERKHEVG